jgi:superfamily I DNA/RNA helicase
MKHWSGHCIKNTAHFWLLGLTMPKTQTKLTDTFVLSANRAKRATTLIPSANQATPKTRASPAGMFVPSTNQANFFAWVTDGSGSAILNAVAGSGKTTSIVQACGLINPSFSITFLAFNKKIATELGDRLPKHARASTFHAAGFSAWRSARQSVTVRADKVSKLAKQLFTDEEWDQFGAMAVKLVAQAKNAGIGILHTNELDSWKELLTRFDIDPAAEDLQLNAMLQKTRELLAASVDAAMDHPSVIDFDDMIYMPLLHNVPFGKADWLLVDEAQDTNGVQLEMLKRMLKPGGRLVAVGDRNQAIYAFRGADSAAMDNIKRAFNCAELSLDVSFRCPRLVVLEAQRIVPHIKFANTAGLGSVINKAHMTASGQWTCMHRVECFRPSDVIVCRNVAPLVELAYRFIRNQIGCKILGREIGATLIALINRMGARSVEALVDKLKDFTQREVAKFTEEEQETRAEAAQDRLDCILAVISTLDEQHWSVGAVVSSIQTMFSDDDGKSILTLCTCHKSKGLEWDRVFIYRRDLMPSKYATRAWQLEQEANLEYVAITRAKQMLVWLQGSSAQSK